MGNRKIKREAKHSPVTGALGRSSWTRWISAGLVIVTLAAFHGAAWCGFIDFDDDTYVVYNPHVWRGITEGNIDWAWRNVEGASWMPLTWMTLQLDGELSHERGGTPEDLRGSLSAQIYHVQNLVWHCGAVVLLFLLMNRLTQRQWASATLALLWAVHPLRVESVVWVAERKDVLAMFWGLLAIYLYVIWREKKSWGWYAGMCTAFCLSLMGKALFVTLPLILLLLDMWPLARIKRLAEWKKALVEKLPLILVTGVFSGITLWAQSQAGAVKGFEQFGLGMRLENAAISCVRYLVMQIDCWNLGIFYSFHGNPGMWQWTGAMTLLGVVTGLCIWQRKTRPWLIVGWLWYLGTLLPVIGIVQVGEQTHTDRYTYLPSIGLLIMVVMSVPRAWWKRPAMAACAGTVGIVLIGMTIRQTTFWRQSVDLFDHTIAITRDNYFVRYHAAIGYVKHGNIARAEALLRESVRIKPDFTAARGYLADLYLQEGKPADAIIELEAAVRQAPENAEFQTMLGVGYFQLRQWEAAYTAMQKALQLDPQNPRIQTNIRAMMHELQLHSQPAPATTVRSG